MDWEAQRKEKEREIEEERKRLIALTDAEAESLPVPVRYQRIRYLREIEAAEWLANLRRGLPPQQEEVKPKRRSFHGSSVKYGHWHD